jgi:MFS family permease
VAGKILGSYVTGHAADRVDERVVFIVGGVASALLVVVATLMPPALLCLLLVLAGTGNSAASPAGGRIVILAFPRRRYGLAQGIRQTGIPLGGLIAALMLPWIAELSSWRVSLIAAAALALLAIVPLMLPAAGARQAALEAQRQPPERVGVDWAATRMLTLWGSLLVSGQVAIVMFLAPDIHERTGLSLAAASLIVAAALVAGVAGRVGWGIVSDRRLAWGRKWLLGVISALGTSAALLLLALPASTPIAVFVIAAMYAGVTLIGYQAVSWAMLAEAAGPDRMGAVTGFAVTFMLAGAALAPLLLGAVVDLTGTYRAVWGVLAVVVAAGLIPALLVTERRM